jgi:hypothetical protein
MLTVKVKDGTPENTESLCQTCTWSRITKGFQQTEVIVYCSANYPNQRVPFKVSQCTDYQDMTLPTKREMEKMAWILVTRPGGKTAGFVKADEFPDSDDEC